MKIQFAIILSIVVSFLVLTSAQAEEPSAFGTGFDVQDFYKSFTLDQITPKTN